MASHQFPPTSSISASMETDSAWLDSRAQEIVRQNPGGPFPEHDREFSEATRRKIRILTRARMPGRAYAWFDQGDLEGESALRAIQGFAGFKGNGYGAWLYMVVRNTFCTLLKKDDRTSATSIEEIASQGQGDGYPADELLAAKVNVTEEVDTGRYIDDFLAWLGASNSKHATIIQLDLDGLTDREIARRVNVAYRTVCSVLQRAPRDYKKFLIRRQDERRQQAMATPG